MNGDLLNLAGLLVILAGAAVIGAIAGEWYGYRRGYRAGYRDGNPFRPMLVGITNLQRALAAQAPKMEAAMRQAVQAEADRITKEAADE